MKVKEHIKATCGVDQHVQHKDKDNPIKVILRCLYIYNFQCESCPRVETGPKIIPPFRSSIFNQELESM